MTSGTTIWLTPASTRRSTSASAAPLPTAGVDEEVSVRLLAGLRRDSATGTDRSAGIGVDSAFDEGATGCVAVGGVRLTQSQHGRSGRW